MSIYNGDTQARWGVGVGGGKSHKRCGRGVWTGRKQREAGPNPYGSEQKCKKSLNFGCVGSVLFVNYCNVVRVLCELFHDLVAVSFGSSQFWFCSVGVFFVFVFVFCFFLFFCGSVGFWVCECWVRDVFGGFQTQIFVGFVRFFVLKIFWFLLHFLSLKSPSLGCSEVLFNFLYICEHRLVNGRFFFFSNS